MAVLFPGLRERADRHPPRDQLGAVGDGERWRHVADVTFGPATGRPPSGSHVPQRLLVGDVAAVRVSAPRVADATLTPD
jgi:hypothetical protein